MFWKWVVIPFILRSIQNCLNIPYKHFNSIKENDIIFQCFLGIINNIIIPLVAATTISPNCFHNALFSPDSVESTYKYSQCVSFSIDGNCMELRIFEAITSYQPPFSYSYQCMFFI